MKKITVLLVVFAVLGILLFLTYEKIQSPEENTRTLHITDIELPPNFQLQTLNNKEVSIENFYDPTRKTLLVLWASWCPTCAAEMSLLNKLHEQWRIVGINFVDTKKNAEKFLQKFGNPFEFNIFDPKGILGVSLGVTGTPEIFVIDAKGNIIAKHKGPVTEDFIKKQLSKSSPVQQQHVN